MTSRLRAFPTLGPDLSTPVPETTCPSRSRAERRRGADLVGRVGNPAGATRGARTPSVPRAPATRNRGDFLAIPGEPMPTDDTPTNPAAALRHLADWCERHGVAPYSVAIFAGEVHDVGMTPANLDRLRGAPGAVFARQPWVASSGYVAHDTVSVDGFTAHCLRTQAELDADAVTP